MPNHVNLSRKYNVQAGPVSPREIDKEMCEAFGIIPHKENYYYDWIDTIGLALARGKSFDKIIEECTDNIRHHPDSAPYYEIKIRIVEHLREHFISNILGIDR
jgi:hypothetical protein